MGGNAIRNLGGELFMPTRAKLHWLNFSGYCRQTFYDLSHLTSDKTIEGTYLEEGDSEL
jgi:hypothetical protein